MACVFCLPLNKLLHLQPAVYFDLNYSFVGERNYQMATPVLMPKQGNTVEECVLTSWHKKVGEQVAAGEVVAEIETDKASFEIEAPVAGEMLATFFAEGDLVPVLVNIGVIGTAGESVDQFRPDAAPAVAADSAAGAAAAPAAPAAPALSADVAAAPTAVAAAAAAVSPGNAALSPRARRYMQEHPADLTAVAGSGPGGRVLEQDVKAAPRLSPVAAALQKQGQGTPAGGGSGLAGMIVGSDMRSGADIAAAVVAATVPVTAAAAAAAASAAPGSAAAADETVVLSNMRKVIAKRMLQSLSSTAQYTLNASADATALLALRQRIKSQSQSLALANINLNDMVLYAVVQTLQRHPQLNATFNAGKLVQHKSIDLGFACDTERGLLVPVLRNAQALTLAQLAVQAKQLAQQAIAGKLSGDDLSGGTFTVSNLGNLGVMSFTPVLNAPQVGILGVGGVELKPVRRNGEVVFCEHMNLSLTCDHQVVDGAPGARFLQTLVAIIENFDLALAL